MAAAIILVAVLVRVFAPIGAPAAFTGVWFMTLIVATANLISTTISVTTIPVAAVATAACLGRLAVVFVVAVAGPSTYLAWDALRS